MNSDELSELLTGAEAATIVHLAERTLAAHRWRGTGPRFLRAGRKPLYRRSDLIAWLEDCQAKWQERSEAALGVGR